MTSLDGVVLNVELLKQSDCKSKHEAEVIARETTTNHRQGGVSSFEDSCQLCSESNPMRFSVKVVAKVVDEDALRGYNSDKNKHGYNITHHARVVECSGSLMHQPS